jgi:AraC family transcriptional activator of tynA and feaB
VRATRQTELDLSVSFSTGDPVEVLTRGWAEQSGGVIPLPPVNLARAADEYRVRIRHTAVDDAVVEDVYSETITGFTGGHFRHHEELVVLHMPVSGGWSFEGLHDTFELPAGQLCVRSNDRAWQFGIAPATRTNVLAVPAQELRSVLGDQPFVGSQSTPEARLLSAYMELVTANVDGLTDAGLRQARHALVELLKGVLAERNVVADEPVFLPALADAARQLAEVRLLDAGLSARSLARLLNVSVRTLYRAFAESDESVMAYVRGRRLDQARRELAIGGTTVSELAARWQFADGSHFTRAFKDRYGMAPTDYAKGLRR